tara:strand:- start:256 stop:459 length:204 start_codon:yes stop_codon:yes gene_type:complete
VEITNIPKILIDNLKRLIGSPEKMFSTPPPHIDNVKNGRNDKINTSSKVRSFKLVLCLNNNRLSPII